MQLDILDPTFAGFVNPLNVFMNAVAHATAVNLKSARRGGQHHVEGRRRVFQVPPGDPVAAFPEEVKRLARERRAALAKFNRWEAGHPSFTENTEQVLASLGALYALMPSESRHRKEDPDRTGIRRMHELLRHLR